MFRLIRQAFVVWVLRFGGSLTTKCIFLNYQPCIVGTKFVDLNPKKLYCYPFIVSLDRCSDDCNTVEDPSDTIWVLSKIKIEVTNIEPLTSYHGFEQVINEPTHILSNSAVCIDLFSAEKPNLIDKGGVFRSLYVKCHHQIIFSKFNLNAIYLPLYQRLIWDYKKANADCIRTFINSVEWDFDLSNKNIDQQSTSPILN